MSLIVALVAAASAGVAAGAVSARAWIRARKKQAKPAQIPAAPGANPGGTEGLGSALATAAHAGPFVMGDVVQVQDETRWLCAASHLRDGSELRASLWLAGSGGSEGAVMAFVPPARHIYWLSREPLTLPAGAPARIEVRGKLLDRKATFPAAIETEGAEPLALGAEAVVSLYEGAVGDAAVVLQGKNSAAAFAGQRLEEGDYDRLGSAAPAAS